MHSLPQEHYQLVAEQLKDVTINCLFARSVVEQHVSGKVLVDRYPNPRVFHIVHPYGMSLLLGDVGDEQVYNSISDYLLGLNPLKTSAEMLQVFPLTLEDIVDEMLLEKPAFDVMKHQRVNFKFNPQRYEQFRKTVSLADYELCVMDAEIFDGTDGTVVPKRFWNNAREFMERGKGFSLLQNDQPVASAFSAFVHENMLEMGMETHAKMRNRGFAKIVCTRLIDYCLANSLEPVWACKSGNKKSYNLAGKLGFESHQLLPYYQV